MNPARVKELGFVVGDTVLLRGKRRKTTIAIVNADDSIADNKIEINKGSWGVNIHILIFKHSLLHNTHMGGSSGDGGDIFVIAL
jgi:anaerobic selenocysteine-containing dehydrogenase